MIGAMTLRVFGRRTAWFGAVAIFGIFIFTFAFPHRANAQFGGFDPAGQIASMYSGDNWLGKAQQWGQRIYLTLLIFELVALAVTTLLFRDNLGEFFSSLSLKIVVGSVFFWFIANAGVGGLPGKVVSTFTQFGSQLSGGASGDPTVLAAEGLTAAVAYFEAGADAKKADAAAAILLDVPPNCTFALGSGACYETPTNIAMHTHDFFELVVNALALMIATAMAAIYLQFALITIETYLVMGAGTLFIGFSASRFTLPFSQGYFSYMINVGVKIMVLYIILGLLGPLLHNVLLSSAATLLLVSSSDVTGLAYPFALGTATYGALSVVIGAALVTMIPGFASSFLTGQSVASGTAALQQTMSSVAGSTQMMAQFASASQSSKLATSDRSAESTIRGASAAPGASNGQAMAPTSQANTDSMAPTGASQTGGATNDLMQMQQRPPTAGLPSAATGAGTGMQNGESPSSALPTTSTSDGSGGDFDTASAGGNSDNGSMGNLMQMNGSGSQYSGALVGPQGQNYSPASGPEDKGGLGLQDYEAEEIANFSPEQTSRALQNTDMSSVSEDRVRALSQGNPENQKIAEDFLAKRAGDESRNAALSEGYGLGGLAQAAPRDQGQPTAVQVRISNPDKL